MLSRILSCLLVGLVSFGMVGSGEAVVINFDDLAIKTSISGTNLPANYGDIDWDSSVRYFSENANPDFSEPHSGENFVYNQGLEGMLGFSIIDPTFSVESAWFTQAGAGAGTDQVRFVGLDAGSSVAATSSWLTLSSVPQLLPAIDTTSSQPFGPVFRIEIERSPLTSGPNTTRFSMDDLTLVPEPLSLILLLAGVGPALRKKRSILNNS